MPKLLLPANCSPDSFSNTRSYFTKAHTTLLYSGLANAGVTQLVE